MLLSGMHTTYCVATLPCKTSENQQFLLIGKFSKYLTKMLNISYSKCKEQWKTH